MNWQQTIGEDGKLNIPNYREHVVGWMKGDGFYTRDHWKPVWIDFYGGGKNVLWHWREVDQRDPSKEYSLNEIEHWTRVEGPTA